MTIRGDYLWDKTGEPDPEVQELEEILGTLRYQPRPLDIPAGLQVGRRAILFSWFCAAFGNCCDDSDVVARARIVARTATAAAKSAGAVGEERRHAHCANQILRMSQTRTKTLSWRRFIIQTPERIVGPRRRHLNQPQLAANRKASPGQSRKWSATHRRESDRKLRLQRIN